MAPRLGIWLWVVLLTLPSGRAESGERRPEAEKPPRTDHYGDPLPPGATARLGTTRLRHDDQIDALAFSPDGKMLASGGRRFRGGGAQIHFWDPITGKEIRAFEDEETPGVSMLLFSPDSKTLVSLGNYNNLFYAGSHRGGEVIPYKKIHLWDVAAGKRRLTLTGHDSYVTSVDFSPDGKTLASVGADDTIRLWDINTGKAIRVIKQKVDRFFQVFFTLDGKTLVTSSGYSSRHSPDGKSVWTNMSESAIRLWDAATGKQIRNIKVPDGGITIRLSPDGKSAASCGATSIHNKIRVWDLATGKQLGDCPEPGISGFWRWGPDSESLLIGAYDNHQYDTQLYLWDWKKGRKIREFEGKPIHVNATALSLGGQNLAVADGEAIRLWNVLTGKEVSNLTRHLSGVRPIVSPDGRTIATESNDRTIRLWELLSGKPLQVWYQGEGASVVFSPDGKFLASGGKQSVRLWDIKSSHKMSNFVADKSDYIAPIGFSPDGKTLVGHSGMGKFYLWDVKSGKELKRLDVHAIMGAGPVSLFLGVKKLAFFPKEGDNCIYDLDSGSLVNRFTDSEFEFQGCHLTASAFSPDGNFLVTANSYRGVYLRETATGEIISSVKLTAQGPRVQLFSAPPGEPTASIYTLAFSPDSRIVAAGYDNGKAVLWDLLEGKELHTFHGHNSHVNLAFTPDGKYLITGSQDSTALVWKVPESVRHPQRERKTLTDAELRALKADLAGTDARKAYLAIETLAAVPAKSLPLLRRRLRPTPGMDAKQTPHWIDDLDSDRFAAREAAMRNLAQLGDRAETLLRSTLASKPSLEKRRRVEDLLRTIKSETLYTSRAIRVLERIGTPEARQILQDLAQGDSSAWQTRIARVAGERIARRSVEVDR